MPLITLKAQIHADPQTEAVLKDAMFCATKVYNDTEWVGRGKGAILYHGCSALDEVQENKTHRHKALLLPLAVGCISEPAA